MSSSSSVVTDPLAVTQTAPRFRDIWNLFKPRVMSLVVFTGIAGVVAALSIAPASQITLQSPVLLFVGVLLLALGSGSAGAINMWVDRDIDAVMTRTRLRPIPSGRIAPDSALGLALLGAHMAVVMLGLATNWVAAFWLGFAIIFYAWFYSMILKRRTPQNIVIGGAAGAFPPVIGWAMVTGNVSHPLPWLLFALIFLWTPPHFWALALVSSEDYARAKVPMYPVVHGQRQTEIMMIVYAMSLIVTGGALGIWGGLAPFASWGIVGLSALFTLSCIQLRRAPACDKTDIAKKVFGYSIAYLFIVFLLVMMG